MKEGQFFRVSHSLKTSAKLTRLFDDFDPGIALAALGAWTLAGLTASIHRTDGVVHFREFLALGESESISDALAALVTVGLMEFESDKELRVTNWSEHNRTRSEIEALADKRKKSGKLGGAASAQASARPLAQAKEKVCSSAAAVLLEPPVSVSASVSDLNSDPDPEPRFKAIPPKDATVRGALVTGYREAFEREFRSMPTDVRGSEADEAVRAVLARASVLDRDPCELAKSSAAHWFRENSAKWQKPPRWSWFLKDIGGLLADAMPGQPLFGDEPPSSEAIDEMLRSLTGSPS